MPRTTAAQTGTIAGTVSTQNGSVRLPGVVVAVHGEADAELPQPVSDGDGKFTIPDLPPGRYTLSAALDGFQAVEMSVTVAAGATISLTLDLPFAVTEQVDVVARTVVSTSDSLATTETVDSKEAQLLAPGEGIQTAVRLTPGVIELSGGNSIDGARPNQASQQIGAATLVDPATNLSRVTLPADGIDSVSVMSNPYEVEFGRFSSGLVMIQTRRAGDDWKVHVNNLEPNLRVKRYTVFDVDGVVAWKPSVEFGGPIVKDRVFMEQTAQYYYQTTDINSRPENELRTTDWVSSLTRIDANLSERHALMFSAGLVPGRVSNATLGTFTPPAATADLDNHFSHAMVTERAQIASGTFLESMLEFHTYDTSVLGKGPAEMQLLPGTTLGNFFNRQDRSTTSFQWVETASTSRTGPLGVHAMKFGFDLLRTGYEGTSASRPVLVRRSDGTLARRLEFDSQTTQQSVHGTDFAAFVQDRIQPRPRWWIELGGRLDYDAVTGRTDATPRVGAAILLDDTGNTVLRGGIGVFYERTPLVAGAFDDFESALDTRYEADGVTPVGPAVLYTHVTEPNLEVARSTAWDVAYDKRLNRMLALRLSVLGRQGSHELVVDPVRTDTGGALVLSSTGESSYLQEEVNLHVTRGSSLDISTSYIHSSARQDLNNLIEFYDAVLEPIIGSNAYAPAAADAPNRLFVHGRAMPRGSWMVLGTFEWRSGLPYSIVNDALDFVGPRNDQRFPTYVRVDAGLERRLSVKKMHPWVGLRVANALNSFLPVDVQANLGAPDFGNFYNSPFREYRIHVRFEK